MDRRGFVSLLLGVAVASQVKPEKPKVAEGLTGHYREVVALFPVRTGQLVYENPKGCLYKPIGIAMHGAVAGQRLFVQTYGKGRIDFLETN